MTDVVVNKKEAARKNDFQCHSCGNIFFNKLNTDQRNICQLCFLYKDFLFYNSTTLSKTPLTT